MAPDLPYYLPFYQAYPTHTALAVGTSDLVLGALAWLVWHGVLAAPALATAPAALRGRLAGRAVPGLAARLGSVRQGAWLVVALVLGAATHVVWDEFTHPRRWGAEHLSVLAATWGPVPGYRWLQYVSSVVGGLVLLVWFARWWRRTPVRPVRPRPATRWVWLLLGAVGVVFGAAAALAAGSLDDAVFPAARWAGGSALVAAVLLAAAWRLRGSTRQG